MTQDEIIRMAREAGFDVDDPIFPMDAEDIKILKRFAALVAANEREKQADISALPIIIEVAVKEAVIAEREACAKVCDDLQHWVADCCAKDIRARSNNG